MTTIDNTSEATPPDHKPRRTSPSTFKTGLILVVLGILFLLNNILPEFAFADYWPVLLIIVGIGLLWKPQKE